MYTPTKCGCVECVRSSKKCCLTLYQQWATMGCGREGWNEATPHTLLHLPLQEKQKSSRTSLNLTSVLSLIYPAKWLQFLLWILETVGDFWKLMFFNKLLHIYFLSYCIKKERACKYTTKCKLASTNKHRVIGRMLHPVNKCYMSEKAICLQSDIWRDYMLNAT